MITLHILADNCPQERLDRAVRYLERVKPRYVNIGGGSQIDRAMQLVERVRAVVPGIRVIWRNMKPEDTGIHSSMTAQECFNLKVKPDLAWFQKHQVIFMPDNESSSNDMSYYVRWQVEMARLLHAEGLFGAFCRFATGNIREDQYSGLKPIFDAMLPGDIASPNEYSNAPGKSSAGHLARYKLMWNAAGRDLPTVIGEAGIAVDYDPGKGYQSIGLDGKLFAQQMLDEERWYPGVDRCLFVIGGHGWEGFQVGDNVLDYLESYYRDNPPIPAPPVVIPPIADPIPPRVYTPALAYLKNGAAMVNLRSEKSTAPGTDIGDIRAGDKVKYAPLEGNWWPIIHILPNGKETAGFAHNDYFEPVPRQSESPPPENPDPLPIPPSEPPKQRYKLRIQVAYSQLLSMPIEIPLPAGITPEMAHSALSNTLVQLIEV